ncbi:MULTISPECIES: DUF3413 domain-containing protein [Gammaproteobacteria]|uniref:DUF3413 domain-containing protein n=1 Tax=Gammaproteobacteria TaxID=1236 RepID=UPI000DCF6BCC|nr:MULTISPECIES: DUF3413 domain-containing protein [Gammaproteobacteria]RTE87167.1 DUF3413 domain-containing protein [Aliidiomarina sp. B3213]TCZ93045.1 DUF3413 domain-containing protein [Lysobacter sp. N42]
MSKQQHRDRIARSISWGHWFTLGNIIIALLIGTLYLDSAEPAHGALATTYLLVSWIGHFAFLPFVFFIIFIFPFCLFFPYSRFLRAIATVLSSVAIFILLIDALFFQSYSFHLNSNALTQLTSDAEQWFTGGSFILLLGFILVFLLIVLVELILANVTWKKLDDLKAMRSFKPLPGIFIVCFFASHSMHIWADATLYRPITQQDDLFPASYPTTAKSLMTRQGWISMSTYESQRSELEIEQDIRLRYPIQTLLCARKPQTQRSVLVAFDNISLSSRMLIESSLEVSTFQGNHIAHPDLAAAVFQVSYGLPDRLLSAVNRDRVSPAYQETLANNGYSFAWLQTENWETRLLPEQLQTVAQTVTNANEATSHINVIFASENDIRATIQLIQELQATQPETKLIITGLTPSETQSNSISDRLSAPLWYANIEPREDRVLTKHEDLLASFFSQYLSCAESFATFTNGIPLQRISSSYPRYTSISPAIYIFESEKTSLLHANGDVNVYDHEGNRLMQEEPSPVAVIDALKALQRFTEKPD